MRAKDKTKGDLLEFVLFLFSYFFKIVLQNKVKKIILKNKGVNKQIGM